MATQTLPHVVQFPQSVPAVEPITQLELEMYLSLCNRLDSLKEQVATEDTVKALPEPNSVRRRRR